MAIIDSYSESSYLADQLWADLLPHQSVIPQIAALTAHISFLLWELIFGRPGCSDLPPPLHQTATIDSYSESSYLADQVLAALPPAIHQMAMIDSYSESSYLSDQDGQIYPIPLHQTVTIDSYSESSYLADQVLAALPPAIHQMAMIDSYSESSYLADQFGQIYPPIKLWFHRLLLWHLIFHSHSERCSYLADQLIFGRPSVGRSTPLNGSFTGSCSDSSYFIPILKDLVAGRSTHCIKWQL